MQGIESPAVEVSVVVPAFNEQGSIADLCVTLVGMLKRHASSFEIVVVDDGSSDETARVVRRMAKADPRVRLLELTRNFGKESALTAGLVASTGSAVLLLDADFQHPPDLVPSMIDAWRDGYEVVNAHKVSRGAEPFAYGLMSRLFNHLMSAAIGQDMDGASDFKLLDRQVVDAVLACQERHRFFRGIVSWVGFRVTSIDFAVGPRRTGRSNWKVGQLLAYSLSNIVAFTSAPLLLVAFTGFLAVLLGILLLVQTLYTYFNGSAAVGFTTVIAVQILIGGMILLSVGIVAIYVAQLYDESKRRPLFFVRRGSGGGGVESVGASRRSAGEDTVAP
jgi:dolichol-phosphate mannosyltransferase